MLPTDSRVRFRSTVPFYRRFRLRYPDELLAQVAAHGQLDGTGRLLDLGCGPAFIAIAMARYFAEVVGVDPLPEMLAAAADEAAKAGVPVTLIGGSSETLSPALGRFRMVTMGRSFHWMDRFATLAALDDLLEPNGSVVLLSERHLDAENGWRRAWSLTAKRWAAQAWQDRERRRISNDTHEAVLCRSAFSHIERLAVSRTTELTLDEVVGRAWSMSSTSPAALGSKCESFEADLRSALLRVSPSGVFVEREVFEALLARRP